MIVRNLPLLDKNTALCTIGASRSGGTGRRAAFRAQWALARVGSNPTFGTTLSPSPGGAWGFKESSAHMMDKLRESRSWQLLFMTTLILLVALMADVSGRLSVLYRVNQKEAHLTLQRDEALVEQDMLAAQLEYVNGDAYLEKWARGEARLSRPGDVAVIPLLEGKTRKRFTALDDVPSLGGTPSSVSEQWRRFFFEGPGSP